MSEKEPSGTTRNVLWLCVLALGVWLFFEGLEARGEQLETRRLVHDLKEKKDDLDRGTARVRREIEQIESNDPAALKAALQKEDWIEEGRVAVDDAPTPAEKR